MQYQPVPLAGKEARLVLKDLGAVAERHELRVMADLVKSMADETRLTILSMLRDGEMCVCEFMEALPVSQPAVSHHLRILRQAGLITDRRQGKWIFYSLNPEVIESTALLLDRMLFQPARQLQAAGGGPIRQHPACIDNAESDYGL
jgi:ArsR family transcriptional regulator